ncbi:hypothetical protein QE152_g30785 [Popillia japonica]|uniref:Uncharacterized protein n=1 Tax=Popillia japonica TaxID=7064 RepID=A0AAW1JDY2_POPJA
MAKRIPSSPFRIDQEEDKPWVEDEEDNRVKDDKKEVAKKLFTCSSRVGQDYRKRVDTVLPFTAMELKEAVNNMKSGKAPGPNGIPAEAIKETEKINNEWLLDGF